MKDGETNPHPIIVCNKMAALKDICKYNVKKWANINNLDRILVENNMYNTGGS